jgi:hypothetical protein
MLTADKLGTWGVRKQGTMEGKGGWSRNQYLSVHTRWFKYDRANCDLFTHK